VTVRGCAEELVDDPGQQTVGEALTEIGVGSTARC
jgi:hypothetical protein